MKADTRFTPQSKKCLRPDRVYSKYTYNWERFGLQRSIGLFAEIVAEKLAISARYSLSCRPFNAYLIKTILRHSCSVSLHYPILIQAAESQIFVYVLYRDADEPRATYEGGVRHRTSVMSGAGNLGMMPQPLDTQPNQADDKLERESFISSVPDWIGVEELPWKERCEIQLYKLVSLVPVTVTLCLYIYLYIYYVMVSVTALHPAFLVLQACSHTYVLFSPVVLSASNDHTGLQQDFVRCELV